MILVLNEWLFHDLLYENGDLPFRGTARFLVAFAESEDILVIPAEERWKQKAFQLMTMTDLRQRQVSKLLHSLMLDADRAVRIQPDDDPPISQDFLDRCPARMSTWCGLTARRALTFSSPPTGGFSAPSANMMTSTAGCETTSCQGIQHSAARGKPSLRLTRAVSSRGRVITTVVKMVDFSYKPPSSIPEDAV